MHLWALSIHFCQKFYSFTYFYLVALLLVHVVVVAERTLLSGENSIPALQESNKMMHQRKSDKTVKREETDHDNALTIKVDKTLKYEETDQDNGENFENHDEINQYKID